jgi:peptidoglycan/xylan/chitin deacetylase (PgdA/CDA1 family)
MEEKHGFFVVSIDLELFWGMFDKRSLAEYGPRILGERTAIPRMLTLFATYGIHATWAGVGMLMARTKDELLALLPPPDLRPRYENVDASAYHHIETTPIGTSEETDPYHFGPSFVQMILATPHQEFGNHTFSHYYCIDGYKNDAHIFARDLEAFTAIAQTYGISATSIIFPRNQASHEALYTCAEKGIHAYRGNEEHVLYAPRKESEQSFLIRGLRLMDHYINISGHHTYPLPHRDVYGLFNIPASRFFRPWMRPLRFFEWLRIRRIKKSMTHAAKNGEIFHLWWHPHNMGIDQEENFKNLEEILRHFRSLQKRYDMESAGMNEIATRASGRTA